MHSVFHSGGFDDLHHALLEALVVAVRLQLDDDASSALADGERLGERGHALTSELRTGVTADVDRPQLGRVGLPDLHRRAAHFHQVAVVDDQDLAVRRLLDVELDEVRVLLAG